MLRELQDLHDIRPRGLKAGDFICPEIGPRRVRFTVAAIQQWQIKGAPHAVGLVWVSNCASCERPWFQCTETRVERLADCCPECDVVGYAPPALDIKAAQHMLDKAGVYERVAGVRRRGSIELHVLETVKSFGAEDTVKLDELVKRAVAAMPAPRDGKRDTRRQMVVRAVETLSNEQDGPLRLKGDLVVFYE